MVVMVVVIMMLVMVMVTVVVVVAMTVVTIVGLFCLKWLKEPRYGGDSGGVGVRSNDNELTV